MASGCRLADAGTGLAPRQPVHHPSDPNTRPAARRRRRDTARDWLASVDELIDTLGREAAGDVLRQVRRRAAWKGVDSGDRQATPYVNTISPEEQPQFAGDARLEQRIEAWVRWNAMALVVRANRRLQGIGGHLSTYASAATLFEVGLNHFFRGRDHPQGGDQVFFQGHASPGVYARAFLEGRLDERQLLNFRRELQARGGLSSYPHPWLMPGFWEFPTVSMGLGAVTAVHQARFNRYLEARGLAEHTGRVWALLGDGEMDEPESVGALSLAARERLDNLVFVVNCNLQRLDGPVRGNSKIIQELEARFGGAGWNVVKVVWGSAWDRLLREDTDGFLLERMTELVDGDYQRYAARGPVHLREHFFGARPELRRLAGGLSDDQLGRLEYGGHDRHKVWAAYRHAEEEPDRPTVILAKTVKGWGLGPAHEGRNVTHKSKVLDAGEVRAFRDRFDLPIDDDDLEDDEVPLRRPAENAPEMRYLRARREALGGWQPHRRVRGNKLSRPPADLFQESAKGFAGREATTTVCLVRLLGDLLRDRKLGPRIVPIVPDEARTFGIEALFPRIGIYSPSEQRYEPVDADALLTYQEEPGGQILEEGITEAGAMASTIAAGTAYATHGVPMVPFYFFYSMFGFQRVGDLIWAAQDGRARGFLIGATAGRTTLFGEGLQHQDGHSHLLACAHPRVRAYEPAFGYEVAILVRHGLERMRSEDELFYLTVHNEPCEQPAMPRHGEEGICRGLYLLPENDDQEARVRILASGPMVPQAQKARQLLAEDHEVAASVWGVTSWQQLHRDAVEVDRWNRLHPQDDPRTSWLAECLGPAPGPVVAVSDFVKALPLSLGRWLGAGLVALGTDGFGRSDSRAALRDFFEVDSRHIVLAALSALASTGDCSAKHLGEAISRLGIDPDKSNPMECQEWPAK